MKHKIGLRTEICAFSILPGAIFLLCAVSDLLFRIPDIVMTVVGIGTLALWGFVAVMFFRGKTEPEDEMAKKNLNRARTISWGVLIIELSGIALYLIFTGKPVLLTEDAVFIMLSSAELIYGILFLVLDKWGKA